MIVRLRRHWRWLVLVLSLLVLAPSARGVEPVLEFVNGLRERGYYDVAEQYLLTLEQKQNLPAEVRSVIPYELGVTIRDSARRLLIPEEQRVRLDEAQAAFERFAKSAPNHPLAGRANSERAKILVEKARVDLWDADGTSDEVKKKELRENARKLISQAREIFTTAVEQLKQRYESFEGYIPPEQAERLRQREAAEAEYIQAQLNLAETTYWEAQTHDLKDPTRAEQLTQAMLAFENIHTAYRSMIGGLLARLWQGKCLEEMGRIGEALGIYGELLKHEGSSPSMQALQAKAKQFELICRNHESKREYRLVVQLATDWLRSDANRRLRYSETGKGIEWEQARALEQLGQDRTIPENDRTAYLNQALGIARGLARRPGPHKAPAAAMVARLSQVLGRDANDPKDFNTAYGRAEELLNQCKEISGKIQAAQDAGNYAEARQHADARSGVAAEMTRMLNLALRLADSTTDETLRAQAELKLAIGYFYQERPYEATAVSEYFLRTHPSGQPELLRLAGQIALASLNDAYQQADEGDREFEKRHILRLADMLASRWPESDLATGAHLSAGRLAWDDGDFLAAAQAWLKVPASSSEFGTAQLKAGSAFLELYFRGSREEDAADRPSAEQLREWRQNAEQHLQAGVDFETRRTPAGTENVPLIQGKLALAQLRNLAGVYQTTGGVTGALELLTAEPHSVVKAIETGPGETRPNDPASLKSRQFASHVYQQLLRAYIGLRNLEAASQVMAQLEQVGGQDSAALTEVFVQFGRQLQDELMQLKAAGETTRLASVREGFERFLDELYNRDESRQTFNSLLWIAETYTSLGEGTEDDLLKSTEYFNRAANAYERIISRGKSDPAFLGTPQNATVAKVRMLECRLRQRDFEAAEQVLLDVVKESPNAPNVQESGARLYQLWAESGDLSKYEYALNGRKEQQIWGWGELANRMGQHREREDLRPLYHEATYHYAQVFHQRARNESGEKRTASLRNALRVLDTFARTNRSIPDDVYERMNTLYAAVLTDLGQPVAPLRRGGAPSSGAPAAATAAANGTGATPAPVGMDVTPVEAPAPPAASNLGNIIVVLVLVGLGAGAVIGIFLWTTSLAAKQRAARLAAIAAAPPKKKKAKAPAEGSSR